MRLLFLVCFVFLLQAPLKLAAKPNIILVFIDDMGWGDFSCFGNEAAETPHIDRLAKEGVRFEQFYVISPICSPSRSGSSRSPCCAAPASSWRSPAARPWSCSRRARARRAARHLDERPRVVRRDEDGELHRRRQLEWSPADGQSNLSPEKSLRQHMQLSLIHI